MVWVSPSRRYEMLSMKNMEKIQQGSEVIYGSGSGSVFNVVCVVNVCPVHAVDLN